MGRTDRPAPGPGQESVWDYPRPPRAEPVTKRLSVIFNGVTVAATTRGWRVLETSHPPVYYVPAADVRMAHLVAVSGASICEWKGTASYFDVEVDGVCARRAAWSFRAPTAAFAVIKDHVAFYPRLMDACYVGDERVTPQPGGFYGGWVTRDVVGPFKGEPGTAGW